MSKIRPLSPQLVARVTELFQENESRQNIILVQIRKWLSLQPHLKVRMVDQWLIAFVRGCKYSFEDIKMKLEGYYTLKTKYPDVFGNRRDPKDSVFEHFIQSGTLLAYNNKENATKPTIIIGRIEYDYSKYSLDEALKYESMLFDILLYDNDNVTINGAIEIFDLNKFDFSMLSQITVGYITKLVHFAQDRLPISFKSFHYVNAPLSLKIIYEIAKVIAGQNLMKRVFVHSTIEDLYEYVPRTDLPKEYGGDAESFDELKQIWIQKFENYRNWLIEDEQYYADESLRVQKLEEK